MTAGAPQHGSDDRRGHVGRPVHDAVLGIDLGTSSVKVALTTLDAQPITQSVRAYPVHTPAPGRAESDPADWKREIVAAVQESVTRAPGVRIAGIGLSGQMHGVVTADPQGRPTRRAILWADARATEQLTLYRQLPADRLAALRNPLTAGMAGPILSWLAAHEPGTLEASEWALQPKDWVRYWLTGRAAAEPSDASATLLYDLPADTWAVDVAAQLGIDPRLLPVLLPTAGACAGALTVSSAGELGLEPGLPVAAGGADTAVAALGTGLTRPGSFQLTIGTGAQIITPLQIDGHQGDAAGSAGADPSTHLYRTATRKGHYGMAASLNGGLVLSWVCQTLGASWDELYASAAAQASATSPLFLPHLNGERTPYLSSQMRGAWFGLAPQHSRRDLLRAALEGVAFGVKEALDALAPSGVDSGRLSLAGGGTTSPPWRQLLADVLELDLDAVEVPAASARGAAMLGAHAAGFVDEREMLRRLRPRTTVAAISDPSWRSVYRERFDRFRQAARLLQPLTQTESARVTPEGEHAAPRVQATSPDRAPLSTTPDQLLPSPRRYAP